VSFIDGQLTTTIQQKIASGVTAPPPLLAPCTVYVPVIGGKVLAVIGAWCARKTSFLWQCRVGGWRAALLYVGDEDERLAGIPVSQLHFLPELDYCLHPTWSDHLRVTVLLDEIQNVPGWESSVQHLVLRLSLPVFLHCLPHLSICACHRSPSPADFR